MSPSSASHDSVVCASECVNRIYRWIEVSVSAPQVSGPPCSRAGDSVKGAESINPLFHVLRWSARCTYDSRPKLRHLCKPSAPLTKASPRSHLPETHIHLQEHLSQVSNLPDRLAANAENTHTHSPGNRPAPTASLTLNRQLANMHKPHSGLPEEMHNRAPGHDSRPS